MSFTDPADLCTCWKVVSYTCSVCLSPAYRGLGPGRQVLRPDGHRLLIAGSGPAQLALAILLDATRGDREFASRECQRFKAQYVASWPSGQPWVMTSRAVKAWIADRRRAQTQEADVFRRMYWEGR